MGKMAHKTYRHKYIPTKDIKHINTYTKTQSKHINIGIHTSPLGLQIKPETYSADKTESSNVRLPMSGIIIPIFLFG